MATNRNKYCNFHLAPKPKLPYANVRRALRYIGMTGALNVMERYATEQSSNASSQIQSGYSKLARLFSETEEQVSAISDEMDSQ